MGLDYIRAHTGKPWKKRWEGGLDRLKQHSLFEMSLSEAARRLTIEIEPGTQLEIGDILIVEGSTAGVTFSDGLRSLSSLAGANSDLGRALSLGGGYAEATVERIGIFGDTAEVTIK